MTEQQREAFEAWYNEEYVRPIIPADRTEGGYQHPDAQAAWDAWQAALSHAEGEAVDLEIGAGDVLICDLGTASAAGVAFYRDNAAHDVGTHHPELSGMGGTELAGRIFSVMTEKPESLVVLYNAVGRALATLGHPAPHAEGEAFGWFTEDHDTDKSATTYDPVVADRWRKKGWPVWPLYTHPAPQVAGLTETAIKSSPAYRALHREKDHLLGLLKDQAPQVAVPEALTKYDGYVPPEDGSAGEYYVDGWNSCRDAILANSAPAQTVSASVPEQKTWNQAGGREDLRYTEGWNDCRAAMLAAAPAAPAGELVTRCTAGLGCDEKGYCDAAATGQGDLCDRRTMAHEQPVSDPDGLPGTPRPMSTAPRDGTMVRLLVQFTNHGVNDGFDSGPAWTIGANTYDDSGDDEWFIAGWDWQQDCFTAGEGEPLGWLPMLSAPAPDEREIAALALERHADNLIVMAERDGRNSDRESQQTWEEAAYFAKQEADRLRAGKEGE
jgi:hypothetical protein